MLFTPTILSGVYLIEPERFADDRGFFARTYCRKEFEAQALACDWVQCNISFNVKKATLRGMHLQQPPHPERKLVRCTMGAMYDVVVDLRTESPTFKHYVGAELTAQNRRTIYIPEGVAHGFLTLEDNTEVFYQMSEYYAPDCAAGVRWNYPAFGIEWPGAPAVISERDATYPDFTD